MTEVAQPSRKNKFFLLKSGLWKRFIGKVSWMTKIMEIYAIFATFAPGKKATQKFKTVI